MMHYTAGKRTIGSPFNEDELLVYVLILVGIEILYKLMTIILLIPSTYD